MPDDDWMLGSNTVDFRNEERRFALGRWPGGLLMGPATTSERAAWIRLGWEDWKKGWHRTDVPVEWRQAYNLGRRRAKDDDDSARVEG